MSYFDDYKKRLQIDGGSVAGALSQSSINLINSSFEDSPYYFIIKVNNIDVGARVLQTKQSNAREVLFKPGVVYSKGDYVAYDNATWLMVEFNTDGIYPKAAIQRCNESLKWQVVSGNTITTKEYKCFVTTSTTAYPFDLYYQKNPVQMILPTGEVNAFIQLNADTLTITEQQRFIIGGKAFEVVGIDNISDVFNGIGLLKVWMRMDIQVSADDKTNKIAADKNKTQTPSNGGKIW